MDTNPLRIFGLIGLDFITHGDDFVGGGLAFVALTLTIGLTGVPFSQEIVFAGSMAIVLFLMYRLLLELDPAARRALVGTAVIIFVFRAVPLPGPGATWFEIDVLGFDQRFLSVLSLIASGLTLVGMLVLRPLMAPSGAICHSPDWGFQSRGTSAKGAISSVSGSPTRRIQEL